MTCNLSFSAGYTGEVSSCLSNPSMLAVQEFGDMAASILQLHRPQGRAGKLFLQRARINISSLKAITVSVAHLGSAVVVQKLRNQYLNEWTWLCFNKALFIIIDSGPDVIY